MIEGILTLNKKLPEWQNLLYDTLTAKESIPFQWGKQDCMTVACDAIQAMTGLDAMQWARGEYNTKYEAIDTVRKLYGLNFLDTFSRIFNDLGFDETEKVTGGDIAFIKTDNLDPEASELFGGHTLAVVFNDAGNMISPGKDGLLLVLKYELVRAWTL